MTAPLPKLLTLKKASEETGLSVWTLRNLTQTGQIPFCKFQKKIWLKASDLVQLIERNMRSEDVY